ncbi:NUDIX domain-containing protein [Hansschlegelia plantiphila]|uniref:GDP-mannose pyrophosphatase n=1 Tax=Hansschlegelia plantiphila TaxID=374655 RepID=A0A9W6J0W8_9HYPH|nr:NUDIX hydrolase [Hansschlegelia plantiphila]GLK68760.1 hypothetical protein GCM10008179_23980 [Hansschlegelia plantiphila]
MSAGFDDRLADLDAGVALEGPELLHDGYRRLESWRVTLPGPDERGPIHQEREVLRAGPCIAAILVDLERDALVLIRQFRLPAALATGKGDLVEIVAGRVEPGEDLEEAVRREILEETGLEAGKALQLFEFLPTPGILDERAALFLVRVDAGDLQEHCGAVDEHELTRPFMVSIDDAVASLRDPRPRNAYLLLALQWLALNRGQLGMMLS